MTNTLIRQLMAARSIKQAELAELLGVPLDRIKGLTSGRIKKLTREEGEILVKKLNVRAEWLVTGEGEIFQSPEEGEFKARLDALAVASKDAAAFSSEPEIQRLLQAVLYAQSLADPAAKREAILSSLNLESGTALSNREKVLLENYRCSDEIGKRALETTASAVAHKDGGKKKSSK